MCDVCADFLHLLETYEVRITSNDAKHTALLKSEIEIAFGYIQSWPQRQCMCLYRDIKNFERFNLIVQSMICLALHYLKNVHKLVEEYKIMAAANIFSTLIKPSDLAEQQAQTSGADSKDDNTSESDKKQDEGALHRIVHTEEKWILPEIEKLLILVSKAFLLNFPLYIAYKHGTHSRLDEISSEEAAHLSIVCDLHDNEIPVYLLRNISLFCNSGGFSAMMAAFDHPDLPVTSAHAITATVSNIKLWLNYRCIIQLFVPLRSKVLQYMCHLSDQNLRSAATRSMADFVWSAVRDPLDSSVNFDIEGLALAFKYFNSTTLTMRLAGMAQINAHINLFNEICTTETVGEVELVGQKLGDWLTENQIIEHLFGPNLHVEVIKQAHVVLNFLAVENQITEEHINLIWQAAQLKHCSKPIYDILPSLVKNLSPRPALHLYSLLCRLDPKEHTEQSIYIASALTKLIWSRDGGRSQIELVPENILAANVTASSSDSGSMDGSNTDEDQQDDSSSTSRKSPIDIENGGSDSGAPPPCKQARRKRHVCDPTEETAKTKGEEISEITALKAKTDLALQNHRMVNIVDNSSSEEELHQPSVIPIRKKTRKRRKNNNLPLSRLAHELVETIWEGESHSEGEVINDSDCSDNPVPAAVLKHLQGEGPYIRAIGEAHISELLSGVENDGSYSSPMSNKSEKNLADFDDDESPCEEELAQLVSRTHSCIPGFALPSIAMRESSVSGESIKVIQSGSSGGGAVKSVQGKPEETPTTAAVEQTTKESSQPTFTINDVCLPGNTLLWDLLQDDKIGQLGESLALDAEKALATLLCFSTDRLLRTKFIEGCLHNLANNKSVIVSLKLLPKLFASFQQFRAADTHQVTMWAERQHKMMYHFFNNIKAYARAHSIGSDMLVLNSNGSPMYSHKTQVSVRLHFLSSVFSSLGSPKNFRLSLEQVDALWEWLAHDPECCDCYFSWLQSQAKGGDQHALGIEALQHLYLKKLPELRPEEFSMVALMLFQQLCSLARLAIAHYEKQMESISTTSSNIVGMFHLWKIALRAHNTEVSLAAIQYINMYYMGQQLRLEKEFVSQCMDHLVQASNGLRGCEEEYALMCVQRGLMLLNTHLETFRRRYAFHLRRWAIEGKGIGSHSNLKNEGTGPSIRIVLQPAGLSEKSLLHMHSCDLIAELKAEISKWWENLQGGARASGVTAPVLGLLLSEGPLRIITQGQELTSEYDERSLGDVGFKDNQIVYVSLGGRGARRKEPLDHPTLQPPPPKECLPTVLLLQPKYFEKLFRLMQTLGDMEIQGNNNIQTHTKAQLLSRRVWDILAILPTNPNILESFQNLSVDLFECETADNLEERKFRKDAIKRKLADLLHPGNLQKFMYSLHIVESLAMSNLSSGSGGCCNGDFHSAKPISINRLFSTSSSSSSKSNSSQSPRKSSRRRKVSPGESSESGGGADANISDEKSANTENPATKPAAEQQPSKSDQSKSIVEDEEQPAKKKTEENNDNDLPREEEEDYPTTPNPPSPVAYDLKWNEVFIKCGGLQHLYDIFVSGMLQNGHHDNINEWRHDCLASLLRILWLLGFEEHRSEDIPVSISKPHTFMLEMMEVDSCLKRLASILNDEAHTHFTNQLHIRTGFWGRAQVVQYTMNIMVSFVHSSENARMALWNAPEYCGWVRKFILEDPEPSVRREICAGLYRICLGNSQSYQELLAPLLQKLISFLPVAEKMTCFQQSHTHFVSDDGKEPYGPACRDYFWLLARLVDTLTPEMVKVSLDEPNSSAIDIEGLCHTVSKSILCRDFYETRHGYQDDGLVGLINLMTNLVKYDPPFKFSPNALGFIEKIFEFLFDMPSPTNRQKPKCKSPTSRAAAYDLLVELSKNSANNYSLLHGKLLEQHTPGPHPPYPWDYWPRDDGRSECGYVGLTNLGATCYMASCIQHLYMMPQAREAVLVVPPQAAQKHGATLHELQRMFAYLLESERKSYNPRSFCRVYQMDHQPLNTGEQKDMAEFFIDLVSKLEEMTPELKDLVKRLFCGTLSNNVVSLDCGHVSRTAEEFYTVRCQVADMRNLGESLDEVTVKDTLEGDNMYTCSQCGKKVRAEKRACFKKLPQILCFNTMRYTFNMVTMLKEKVNTHFSFPMRLDMSNYVEKTLMPHQYLEDRRNKASAKNQDLDKKTEGDSGKIVSAENCTDEEEETNEYELVGVTVHTGTADGGHYYSFIKERNENTQQHDRWFLFNDAEVKPFDPSQIAAECFGGEMTSKTYDSVTEKYLDFSFEKTNSAYMLFYERRPTNNQMWQRSKMSENPCSSQNVLMQLQMKNAEESAKASLESVTTAVAASAASVAASSPSTSSNISDQNQLEVNETETNAANLSRNNIENSTKTHNIGLPQQGTPSTQQCDIENKNCNGGAGNSSVISRIPDVGRKSLLSKELEDWIWQDNRHFLQDRNIFEHTYFNFMWQICGHIPQTLLMQNDVTCMAAKLSVSFFIETFIHAKEKPTMVLWVELLTKQFNASQEACEWFLTHMSIEPWWPVQVLIQCPNQMVRQMFQRLVIHVIQRLRSSHASLYLKTDTDENGKESYGTSSCITRFISSLILLMEHGARQHLRHLSEFFGLLFEFSRMGDEETVFLLRVNVIRSVADFYLGNKSQDCIDVGSDNEDNSSDEALSVDKSRPASLDKMIALVANLVERSRGQDFRLRLSQKDYNAIAGGKGFPFLYQQIKDNINPHQTRHLIHALCRWDDRLANQIITMLFASVTKHTELCGPFFKLLTLLTEPQGGPSGLPCFSQLVLQRVWDAAEYCPQSALDWLAFQAPKNKIAHAWILQSAESWVEQFLLAHNNSRVRNAASYLLVSLIPSTPFRAHFRTYSLHKMNNTIISPRDLNSDAQIILHNIISLLLRLLRPARSYADIGIHGTTKLTSYFSLLTYCMVSKTEKLMLGPYMRSLWDLFHPRLSEPSVPAHHNKHSLLAFWHHSILDCPENAQIVANCPEITRNIAFNYILADHDDSEIVAYNRAMLPAYYGLLRLCCQQSRSLTRQLAAHQNLQWAFKNITPHPTQYPGAVDELFKLMNLFSTRHPDATEQEQHEVSTFRRTTLSAYLTGLDARVSWGTLINALRILVDNDEDRLLVIYNGGIEMCFEALHTLHSMHHEATACHVSGDLQELLTELVLLVTTLRISTRLDSPPKKRQQPLGQHNLVKGMPEAVKRLATFLNTYNPQEICNLSIDVLRELVRNPNLDITSILAPIFTNCHLSAQNAPNSVGPLGPYFPRRGTKAPWPSLSKNAPRPPRPMVQMSIPHNEIIQHGVDKEYDARLDAFYRPYHDFLDVMMRMAVNTNQLNESLVKLSCLAAIEAAPLHFNLFPKFWVGIYNNKSTNKYVELLLANPNLIEYIHIVLRDERTSLNDQYVRNFLEIYYPKIKTSLPISRLLYTISYSLHAKVDLDELCGDLFAIRVIAQTTGVPASVRKQLRASLKAVLSKNSCDISENDDVRPKKKLKLNQQNSMEVTENDETEVTNTEVHNTDVNLPATVEVTKTTSKDDENPAITVTTIPPTTSTSTTNTAAAETSSSTTQQKPSLSTSIASSNTTEEESKPLDESNDADDEDDDDEVKELRRQKELLRKSVEEKLAEERLKEQQLLHTIENYIKSILDLIQDDEMSEDDASADNTPPATTSATQNIVSCSSAAAVNSNAGAATNPESKINTE
ncbi:ubiquitin carboxyl-terminal hydrolase puf isoform X2 [Episyrphus balteatus]|uniref:ubiquitin carboxyl-terminal hydrolase puf isoform X2 n=1 Tax=Episyrphus balteatus TaxID=286459 RepID=UPI002486471A|nr:ubiquitin carboxyl-terminal hydrolase puf isoform X2 [Episyrphus balteatus]